MSLDETKGSSVAVCPETSAFEQHDLLKAFCECWQTARKGKMLPSKKDFEGEVLAYPQVLPNMSVMEVISRDEINYIYLGSNLVFQRNKDQTKEDVSRAMAPGVKDFMRDLVMAGIGSPFLAYWTAKSHLESGLSVTNTGLSAVLSDDSEQPSFIVAVTVGDDAHRDTLGRRGYQIAQDGVTVVPIDIGCGVPTMPLSAN